ncbi:MAG: hypothetical protein JWR21_2303 [Herminiimonas sp.]|nr:hypothetical protein [Herminiimonas sp.]
MESKRTKVRISVAGMFIAGYISTLFDSQAQFFGNHNCIDRLSRESIR